MFLQAYLSIGWNIVAGASAILLIIYLKDPQEKTSRIVAESCSNSGINVFKDYFECSF